MPYNTTAIPPRKEVTGTALLPLTRVKKIIAVDPDIAICSNNAAFVITVATELFIQHLTSEAHNMAKSERKPRRNIQYKDLSNAVAHKDNLEFLEDVIPKTASYKLVKEKAAVTRAKLKGDKAAMAASKAAVGGGGGEGNAGGRDAPEMPNGKKHKSSGGSSILNGGGGGTINGSGSGSGFSRRRVLSLDAADPNAQLELEMRQAQSQQSLDGDVEMAD
ncbi:histone-fold-containing protein [Podospora didyma]|uniref:Histone-fold-containing protein n=1 Tax=Podospora didyma TaxID=330526 RepID=A0AAE0U5C4_9PEZI|nr:histone-fold-containing protein [Podospora didyma]